MTEDEARVWLVDQLGVSRETIERLDTFRSMVIAENARQNLVSAASVDAFWSRHIVDSAQLWEINAGEDKSGGAWLDLGTGAGFPGMVIAILSKQPITFVESRRKRIEFLAESAQNLVLRHVTVQATRLEAMETAPFSVITARAFAPLPRLFALAHRFSTEKTVWLLPKGRSAREELETAQQSWHGSFHVKQSVTDSDAAIIVAQGIRPKRKR